MANLIPSNSWDDIYQLERTDRVLAGNGGITNVPLQNLVNRSERIRQLMLELGVDFSNNEIGGKLFKPIDSITDLRLYEGKENGEIIYLKYHTSSGDGGHGSFRWDASSTAADDNGITVAVTGIATGRWIRQHVGKINVLFFGADRTGVNDSTSAIQTAVDYAENYARLTGDYTSKVAKLVYVPSGRYKIGPSGIHFFGWRSGLIGDGIDTAFEFVPDADDQIMFRVDTEGYDATYPVQFAFKDFSYFSSDTTYRKIGIDLVNISQSELNNVKVKVPNWHGNGSIPLRIQGRELTSIRSCRFRGDRPIRVLKIPTGYPGEATSGFDMFNFHDLTLGGTVAPDTLYPLIEVDDGVKLSNISFTGYQSWNLGSHGFYWDNTSAITALNLSFENVRMEQPQDANAWMFYIKHNANVNGLIFKNIYGGGRNGVYIRKAKNVTFDNFQFTSSSKEAVNVDSTLYGLEFRNCRWEPGATASVTEQTLVWKTQEYGAAVPLPASGYYQNSLLTRDRLVMGDEIGTGVRIDTAVTLEDSATPSVAGGRLFKTGGTTAITNFIGGEEGQVIEIHAEHTITVTRGASMRMAGAANFNMDIYDVLIMRRVGNVWREVTRSANN